MGYLIDILIGAGSRVVAGEVTVASRSTKLNGLAIEEGQYLGLAEQEAVASGADFDSCAHPGAAAANSTAHRTADALLFMMSSREHRRTVY